jgi:cyclopropane fatty-acyl-phospholipid synthase-like methyltransferase
MREKVKEGYENVDYEEMYREDREIRSEERELFEKLFDKLANSGKILDLGCGTGLPFDRYLVDNGFEVTGVDIAKNHVEKARENLPEANIIQGDFFEVEIEKGSLDAVVSFYAIFHIPREEHKKLFEMINDLLKSKGYILVTIASAEMEDKTETWDGADMAWSSHKPSKTLKIIEESGFEILDSYKEEWRDEEHFWVLAGKE